MHKITLLYSTTKFLLNQVNFFMSLFFNIKEKTAQLCGFLENFIKLRKRHL